MATKRTALNPAKVNTVKSNLRCARLAAVLWQARKRLGLTLTEAGRRLGVRATLISGWETGSVFPKDDRLCSVAVLLGIDPTELRLLRAAARVDVAFRRGKPSLEAMHRRIVHIIESEADLSPRDLIAGGKKVRQIRDIRAA